MFDKIRQVVKTALAAPTPAADTTPVAPATTPKTDTLDATTAIAALVPTADTLDAAVGSAPSSRVDLVTIKVAGLDQAKQYAVWLTKGQDRTQPATAVRLADCTSDHLKNIVANKPDLSADYLRVIESILEDRGETLPDTDADPADDGFVS